MCYNVLVMAKIIQNYKDCIGCGTCEALCPKFWKMNYDEARASLIGSKKNNKTEEFELEIKDKDIGCNKEAAEVCPVQVIRIE